MFVSPLLSWHVVQVVMCCLGPSWGRWSLANRQSSRVISRCIRRERRGVSSNAHTTRFADIVIIRETQPVTRPQSRMWPFVTSRLTSSADRIRSVYGATDPPFCYKAIRYARNSKTRVYWHSYVCRTQLVSQECMQQATMENYQRLQKLGSGNFAKVHLAVHIPTKTQVRTLSMSDATIRGCMPWQPSECARRGEQCSPGFLLMTWAGH